MEFEQGFNRPGNDYANFALSTPDPGVCRTACIMNPQCRAMTYVRPGVQGQAPRCWLKTHTPVGHYDDCCVSAVIR